MARTSRKKRQGSSLGVSGIMKAALYVRLSVEDNGSIGRDSVENQLELLQNFSNQFEQIKIVKTYIDNGQTGTDFVRPEWERLMGDVKNRIVNCIIVKDLSRFARNYLEAGDYLQKIFPFIGVRLIAVNDQYDSANELFPEKDLIAEFKNLANDQYSKDISRKVISAFRTKKGNGEFIGNKAPYGYIIKDHHFVIDEPAAAVVRRIFFMKIQGISSYRIADILNKEGIFSPGSYAREQGYQKYRDSDVLWQAGAISRILYNRVYAGDLVQGKYNRSIYTSQKRGLRKEADWEILENAHEAIIEKKLFEQVQEIRKKNKKIRQDKQENPSYKNVLEGILICGVCKRVMYRNKDVRNQKAQYYFYCASSYLDPHAKCNTSSVVDYRIFNLVLKQIKLQIELAVEAKAVIEKMKQANGFAVLLDHKKRELERIREERNRYLYLKTEIYEDFKQGILSREEFCCAKERYTQQIEALDEKMEGMEAEKKEFEAVINTENKWLQAFLRFRDEKELTREMAVELLEKVEIYKDKRIHITFRFRNEYEYLISQIELGGEKGGENIPG